MLYSVTMEVASLVTLAFPWQWIKHSNVNTLRLKGEHWIDFWSIALLCILYCNDICLGKTNFHFQNHMELICGGYNIVQISDSLQAWACSKGRSHLDHCLLIGWIYIYPIRAQLLYVQIWMITTSEPYTCSNSTFITLLLPANIDISILSSCYHSDLAC